MGANGLCIIYLLTGLSTGLCIQLVLSKCLLCEHPCAFIHLSDLSAHSLCQVPTGPGTQDSVTYLPPFRAGSEVDLRASRDGSLCKVSSRDTGVPRRGAKARQGTFELDPELNWTWGSTHGEGAEAELGACG